MTRAAGAGDQGRAGKDRPAAEATRRGAQDGPDRHHRHGGAAREFAEPGDIDKLNELAAADRGLPARAGRAAGPGTRTRAASSSRPRPIGCFRASCWSGSSASCRPSRTGRHQGPVVGEGRGRAAARPSPTSSATRSPTWTSPARSINALVRDGPGLPVRLKHRRHPDPPHAQHAQVRHVRADGHERLDALRRPVHQREADGPGARRADPPRVSGRLAAVHRDVHASPSCVRAGRDRRT